MARWDKLLSLPVQSPPKFEFSAADLAWSKVEGWADNIEKVAFIPFDRVDDFLNGESANKEFPTRFYVEARRRGNPSKEKVDGILEFTILERSLRRSKYDLDEDDAVSIEMWADKHEGDVFFREDCSDSSPFILGIQTEWQLQQMIRFSNRSIVASDSRFGTNKLKYPVHSLLVFDLDGNAIPVAWIISPQSANGDAYKWIRALQRRIHSKDPTWKLAGFIVDDPLTDILTIREVFDCSVLISFWRVRHAWHKNLEKKCLDIEMRSEMSRWLGQAIYNICKGNGDLELFENFMEDFVDCTDFMDYFRASWFPRIGWALTF